MSDKLSPKQQRLASVRAGCEAVLAAVDESLGRMRRFRPVAADRDLIRQMIQETKLYRQILLGDIANLDAQLAALQPARKGGQKRTQRLQDRKSARIALLRDTYPPQPNRTACRKFTREARALLETKAPHLLPPVNATEFLDELVEALVDAPPS